MRKSSPLLEPFFSALMQSVLGATVLRPQHEWYLSDLADHLGVGPSSLQRILAQLSSAGVLTRRQDGNRVYYSVDTSCPILAELTGILEKTVGIAEPIGEALAPFKDKVEIAFIHGSVAEAREQSGSDVDMIVVGNVSSRDLTNAIAPLHDRLGREVNFSRFTADEFREKLADGNHFLTAVLKKKRIFLIGNDDELGKITGRKTGDIGTDEHK